MSNELTNQDYLTAAILHAYEAGRRSVKNPQIREVLVPDDAQAKSLQNHPRWREVHGSVSPFIESVAQTEPRGMVHAAGELINGVKNVHQKVQSLGDLLVAITPGPRSERGNKKGSK